VAGPWIDGETLGIEAVTEDGGVFVEVSRVQTIQLWPHACQQAIGIAELDGAR
jgi:hypothetical protein